MIRLIYLAAPLSGTDVHTRRVRLLNAQDLRDAIEADLRAMVYSPHERIGRRYGYPTDEESAQDRATALAECFAALRMVRESGGALHILAMPDGTLSRGCEAELDHWIELGGPPPIIWRATESGWISADGRYGMGGA